MVPNKIQLKKRLEKALQKDFGKRCETKDIEDFPDLLDNPDKTSRCPVCVAYEKLDAFVDDLWGAI